MRRAVWIAVVGTTILAGCSATPQPARSPAPSDEPTSLSPSANAVYDCIVAKGWDVSLTWDGGISASSESVPTEQREYFQADSAACWAEVDGRIAAMGSADIQKVYELELETRTCLIARGFSVDDPPSAQVFLDSWSQAPWSAYAASDLEAAMADESAWRELNETCPQPAWSLGAP